MISEPVLAEIDFTNLSAIFLKISFIFLTIGILLGSIVPEELGLSFTIPLTFLALLINYFRKIDHLIVIFLSGLSSILFYEAPLKSYIILSCVISLFIIFLINKFQKKI